MNDKREKVEQLMEIFTILNGNRRDFNFIHEIKTQMCFFCDNLNFSFAVPSDTVFYCAP